VKHPIQIAAQLLEVRDLLRSVYGDDYARRRDQYVPVVRAAMERTSKPALSGLLTVKKVCDLHGDELPLFCIAAAVDMTEGLA
jgi:hypothetical protein